jgi:NAD+ synthase (glutamine-hydrolysing)
LGTNNKDEGAYLGYFGKASDGMVDLQMISDIHKSEVYLLANDMNIPKEIINAVPSGDMYDARTDEQVFGAPYDFVELYLNCLETVMPQMQDEEACEQFDMLANNLENLHAYNGHKYLAASPAVHLDLEQYQYSFNGSWKYYNFKSKEGV